MGKKLSELGFTNEAVGQDVKYDDLPEFGRMRPLLPVGTYRFRLPAATALGSAFDKIAKTETRGERLNVLFDEDAPLLIVQSPGGDHNGQPYETRISNVERARGKAGIEASDLDYLLRATGAKEKPKTNPAYAQALIAVAGKEFTADARWSWFCSPKRAAYFDDGQGGTAPVYAEGADENTPEDQRYAKGCNKRMYMERDVQRTPEGNWPERVICPDCGASVRAFDGLENIRA